MQVRKCHFIDKINEKTSKYMKNVKFGVNIGTKVNKPNPLQAGLPDVDLIISFKD